MVVKKRINNKGIARCRRCRAIMRAKTARVVGDARVAGGAGAAAVVAGGAGAAAVVAGGAGAAAVVAGERARKRAAAMLAHAIPIEFGADLEFDDHIRPAAALRLQADLPAGCFSQPVAAPPGPCLAVLPGEPPPLAVDGWSPPGGGVDLCCHEEIDFDRDPAIGGRGSGVPSPPPVGRVFFQYQFPGVPAAAAPVAPAAPAADLFCHEVLDCGLWCRNKENIPP